MQSNFRTHFGRGRYNATWRENCAGRRHALRSVRAARKEIGTKHCDGAATEEVNAGQRGWKTQKPLTGRAKCVCGRSGAEVTKLGMGGTQARMNKQYIQANLWRPPWREP